MLVTAVEMLDQPASDQPAHGVGHDGEGYAVIRPQTGFDQLAAQSSGRLLDAGGQVFVIEGENQIVVVGNPLFRFTGPGAGGHVARLADDAVDIEQDAASIPYAAGNRLHIIVVDELVLYLIDHSQPRIGRLETDGVRHHLLEVDADRVDQVFGLFRLRQSVPG